MDKIKSEKSKPFLWLSFLFPTFREGIMVSLAMVNKAVVVLALLASCASAPSRKIAFVAKNATEATLRFDHWVEVISSAKPSEKRAREQVEKQVQHLFGPLERARCSAAPKEDHVLKILSVDRSPERSDSFRVSYRYRGTLVVEKCAGSQLEFFLPNNPDTIYDQAQAGLSKNPCTDSHYQSEEDFWYFWSPAPFYPRCALKKGIHYQVVRGSMERIAPEARTTYPEYHRLAGANGEISLHLFFGVDEPNGERDPDLSRDINAQVYRQVRKELRKMGFSLRRWNNSEIREVVGEGRSRLPVVEELVQEYGSRVKKIKIRLFFGETGIDENSAPFHFLLRDALQTASVMIYDGHSGLGGNLDLQDISRERKFRVQLPRDRYQIFFFNSCTSYTYYNSTYFQRKRKVGRGVDGPKGTHNLDILANGLSTAFDTMVATNVTLIRAIHLWAERGTWTSYQRLAREIDTDNLFTVNGDEDNPTSPIR